MKQHVDPDDGFNFPAKAAALKVVWTEMLGRSNDDQFARRGEYAIPGYVLCLPWSRRPREQQEVEIIHRLGVPYSRIVGVDNERAKLAVTSRKFPGIVTQGMTGDVVDAVRLFPYKFCAMNLDLCGRYMSAAQIVKDILALDKLTKRAYIAVTIFNGRERADEWDAISNSDMGQMGLLTGQDRKRIEQVKGGNEVEVCRTGTYTTPTFRKMTYVIFAITQGDEK